LLSSLRLLSSLIYPRAREGRGNARPQYAGEDVSS
jgi:hypothetical protein